MTVAIEQFEAPRTKRWTKQEYNDLVDRGAFEGQKIYLFRGELIEMPSMKNPHAMAVMKATKAMFALFDSNHFDIRVQMPMEAAGASMPEPDILVCRAAAGKRWPHPVEAIVVIEVADTSIRLDREKALEYAASNVIEYWLVDVNARSVEIYRNAVVDNSTSLGFRYSQMTAAYEKQTIDVPGLAGRTLSVENLLP